MTKISFKNLHGVSNSLLDPDFSIFRVLMRRFFGTSCVITTASNMIMIYGMAISVSYYQLMPVLRGLNGMRITIWYVILWAKLFVWLLSAVQWYTQGLNADSLLIRMITGAWGGNVGPIRKLMTTSGRVCRWQVRRHHDTSTWYTTDNKN